MKRLLIPLILISLLGCDDNYISKNLKDATEATIITNNHNQVVIEVEKDGLASCISRHTNERIVSLSSCARGSSNTQTFVIVFEKCPSSKVPTCPTCGQITLEKKN